MSTDKNLQDESENIEEILAKQAIAEAKCKAKKNEEADEDEDEGLEESSDEDEDGDDDGEDEDMKEHLDFSEDIAALISDEDNLTEGFKTKAATIFEAAVNSKLAEETLRLEESYEEKLDEALEVQKSEMVEMVDSYLNYVTESWMKENELAVTAGLKQEVSESFIDSLKTAFSEHYVDVPEGKEDLIESLQAQVEDMKNELNSSMSKNQDLSESLSTLTRDKVLSESKSDLSLIQAEKLEKLAESVEFSSIEEYAEKVNSLKEHYFAKPKPKTITEDVLAEDEDTKNIVSSDLIKASLAALQKSK